MNGSWRIRRAIAGAALCALAMAVAGCQAGENDRPMDPQPAHSQRGGGYGPWENDQAPVTAAPAPVDHRPAPVAAKSAPAPTPSSNAMYLPTGERSTSALMVEKVMPAEAIVGQPFNYKIIVTNLTQAPLDTVRVSDDVQGMKIKSADPTGKAEGNTMTWNLGDLPGRGQRTITVTAAAAAAGQASGCCGATWSNALCSVLNVVQPALRVAQTITTDALVCDTIVAHIDVANSGTGTASNVRVHDQLPSGLTTTDGKSVADFDAGTLAAGQSRSFTANLKASKTGRYETMATASADGNLNAESSTVSVTVRQPVLEITADCPEDTLIERNTTYKITVKNKGDAACKGTTLTAQVPSGVTFAGADSGGAAADSNVNWNLGELAPGASRTVSLTIRAANAGQFFSTATASGVCGAPVTDKCTFKAAGSPDIGATLSDADGVVLVGTNHIYTYKVVNQGQVNLTNVKCVVTLPSELDYVSTDAQPGPRIDGRKLEFSVGTLAPKASRLITFTVKATKSGEVSVTSETTCAELHNAMRKDEITNFVDR